MNPNITKNEVAASVGIDLSFSKYVVIASKVNILQYVKMDRAKGY
jgi:hypothetical protein